MSEHARVVIIGGGAVGCSALYHLALKGWTECILLERDELTSGSTWHAAGNCPTFSTSWNVLKLQRYGNALYARLASEGDPPRTWHATGSIRLAHGRDRMDEFRHVCAMARAQGLELAPISLSEAKELYPYLEPHGLEGALFDPYDGDVDPSQLTQAFARRAREQGCEIRRFTRVIGLEPRKDAAFFDMPPGDSGKAVAIGSASLPMHISAKTKQPDLAAAYLDAITGPSAAQALVDTQQVPAAVDATAQPGDPLGKEVQEGWQKLVEDGGLTLFPDWSSPTMLQTMGQTFQEMLAGRMSPEEVIKRIQSDWDEYHSELEA
jgi:hypothetical protein